MDGIQILFSILTAFGPDKEFEIRYVGHNAVAYSYLGYKR